MLLSGQPGVGKTLTAESGNSCFHPGCQIPELIHDSGRGNEEAFIFDERRRAG